MDCEQLREAMTAYLYDETTDGERVAVEAHLATCVACRERLEDDRETLRRLDGWSMPTVVAPAIAPRRQPPSRWRAPLAGAAAAAAVFAALAWIGTRAEWRDGRVSITFGRGAAPATIAEDVRAAGLRPLVEVVAREQVDGRMRSLARAFDAVLLEEEDRREERLLTLVATLERQQARTRRLLVNRLDRLGLNDRLRRDFQDTELDDAAREWERLADDPNRTPTTNRKDSIR